MKCERDFWVRRKEQKNISEVEKPGVCLENDDSPNMVTCNFL